MLAELVQVKDTQVKVGLRSPSFVMRLERLGSLFPSRLSFIPTLLRRLAEEDWQISCREYELDRHGTGHAVYEARGPHRSYSLVASSQELEPHRRTDRVIAEAWDATFVLYDGVPTVEDVERLRQNTPLQEAGRYTPNELVLARANRSVRLFEHVVESLADGRQPDRAFLAQVGYLMRTTAVYGNGKFGIADRAKIADRPELTGPFQAEMMALYLIRCFTFDLVEHVARARAPETFVPLEPPLKRMLGIGNATGLGMAPFLVSHPVLINNWIQARETALARVRSLSNAPPERLAAFGSALADARAHVAEWRVGDPVQSARIERLTSDFALLETYFSGLSADASPFPWDGLYRWAEETLSIEAQEFLVSLLIEVHGELVDDLVQAMAATTAECLEPAMSAEELGSILARVYGWALAIDFSSPEAQKLFWYVSEEKLEPRLGFRDSEPGADKEMPLAVARDVQALNRVLGTSSPDMSAARICIEHPELRHIVERAQTIARHPYGEIHDSLIDASCLPIDLLRCKLSFFGASKFDPKSDRWTRITMFAGAPLPDEIRTGTRTFSVLGPTVPPG